VTSSTAKSSSLLTLSTANFYVRKDEDFAVDDVRKHEDFAADDVRKHEDFPVDDVRKDEDLGADDVKKDEKFAVNNVSKDEDFAVDDVTDLTPSSEEIISSFVRWIPRLRTSIGLSIISGVLDNTDTASIGISGCACSVDASLKTSSTTKSSSFLTWSTAKLSSFLTSSIARFLSRKLYSDRWTFEDEESTVQMMILFLLRKV
jgi:hypothetical protein